MEFLKVCEWELILGAYAYEVKDEGVMSDNSFDWLAKDIHDKEGTDIPGFDPSTGNWIHNLDMNLIGKVYDKAQSYFPDAMDLHHPQIIDALNEFGIEFLCCNNGVCYDTE